MSILRPPILLDELNRSSRSGRFVRQQSGSEGFSAFIPAALPPVPPVLVDGGLQQLLERASRELGRLDSIALLLPHPDLFIYMYARKEAVLSSQIEGTQSTLTDLLRAESEETPGVPVDDVSEVLNYTAAMDHGLGRIRSGFPLSLRLIREIHAILMRSGRGSFKTPGEFRKSQNWIGGSRPGNARYVPPPVHEMDRALADLEKFWHDRDHPMPLLLKTGLVHAHFQTIHPFLDGNGRAGRLLITFMLCAEGALTQPLLYLSLFLKENRSEYYDRLQRIRTHGEWEQWLDFYLTGVEVVARQATETARKIVELFEKDRQRILAARLGSAVALRVFDTLGQTPVLSIPRLAKTLALSKQTVGKAVTRLEELGILTEETGRIRYRSWVYRNYLDLLNAGTEP